jgi:hypothetical protein
MFHCAVSVLVHFALHLMPIDDQALFLYHCGMTHLISAHCQLQAGELTPFQFLHALSMKRRLMQLAA